MWLLAIELEIVSLFLCLFIWSFKSLGKAFFFLEINMAWDFLGLTIIWFTFIRSIVFCDSSVRVSIRSSPLAAKNSLFQSCALLLSCRLYYFSLHDDYPPSLYTMWSIDIAGLPFLINWNEKLSSESNILTIDHKFVLDNSSSDTVNTLPNTIIYLEAVKYLDIRLRQIC